MSVRISVIVLVTTLLGVASANPAQAQVRLADDSDRAAFRAWFVLLADVQFERPTADVTDCASLVRFAMREALRAHTPAWAKRLALPFLPQFPDVRSAPRGSDTGVPLFRVSAQSSRYAEFADAKTIVSLNASPVSRDVSRARPGDLLYFHQPGQTEPDHLMIVVGQSQFESAGTDWVVYHTGPAADGPGEMRKVRLADLRQHPAPRWRPIPGNRSFIGVFRLSAVTPL